MARARAGHSISVPRTARLPHSTTKSVLIAASVALAASSPRLAGAETTVQIPIDALRDGRPVSTFSAGNVVRWTTGVDQHDGFATNAAIAALKQSGPGLPDDGTFAANAEHPLMVLSFSNSAPAASQQAHIVPAAGSFELAVPQGRYSKLYLALTSSSGDSALSVQLDYASGEPTSFDFTLPDWGTGKPLPTNPPIFFDLIAGLHKWDEADSSVDTPSHALTGVVLAPDATRALTKLALSKADAEQYLVFWGATGVAELTESGAAGAGGVAELGEAGASGAMSDPNAEGGASSNGAAGRGGSSTTNGGGGASAVTSSGGSSAAAGALPAAQHDSASGCSMSRRARSADATPSFVAALLVALAAAGIPRSRYLGCPRAMSA